MRPDRGEAFPPPHRQRATRTQLGLALLFLIGTSAIGWGVVVWLLP